MIKYHHDIDQGTDEWLAIRLGIVTASEMNNLITPSGNLAKNEKMRTYACQIAAEREFKYIDEQFESYHMMRGHIEEGTARDYYIDNYSDVDQCGFITNTFGDIALGASPDGLVGEDGCIEIKSRLAKFQVQTIISGEVPTEYINQIQAVLLVSGRDWCDFIQYSNGMELFVKRVTVDQERQDQIKCALEVFECTVQDVMDKYKNRSSGSIKTERVEVVFGNQDAIVTESKGE